MRRAAIGLIAVPTLLLSFALLGAALRARDAIAHGALDKPETCLVKRDFSRWKASQLPPPHKLGVLGSQVRAHYRRGRPAGGMADWHWQGTTGMVGVWIGYNAEEREAMFRRLVDRMTLCGRQNTASQLRKHRSQDEHGNGKGISEVSAR